MKTKMLLIRLTDEQHKILEAKVHSAGYCKKSDYIRSLIFRKKPLQEQIEELIHENKNLLSKIENQQVKNNQRQRPALGKNKRRM